MKQNIIIAISAIAIFVVYTLGVYGKGTKDERGKWEIKLSTAQAAAEKSAREKEVELNAKIETLTNQARQDEKNYIAVIDTANAAAVSLREQADIYAAKADSCAATTSRGNSGTSCALLAKLFGEADARAGELAEAADRAIMAGGKCVQMYGVIKNQR
jgi:hypothetical protein